MRKIVPYLHTQGLKGYARFVKLPIGRLAAPRFSSLSGALMCDSKKGLQPQLRLGFFLAAAHFI
jgi:hypothetical protein